MSTSIIMVTKSSLLVNKIYFIHSNWRYCQGIGKIGFPYPTIFANFSCSAYCPVGFPAISSLLQLYSHGGRIRAVQISINHHLKQVDITIFVVWLHIPYWKSNVMNIVDIFSRCTSVSKWVVRYIKVSYHWDIAPLHDSFCTKAINRIFLSHYVILNLLI